MRRTVLYGHVARELLRLAEVGQVHALKATAAQDRQNVRRFDVSVDGWH